MDHKTNPVGNNIYASLYCVPSEVLKNNEYIEQVMRGAARVEGFKIVGGVRREFTPHGLTICFIISESHIIGHTYPEYGYMDLNLSTCRGPDSGEKALEYILKKIKHKKEIVTRFKSIKDINLLESNVRE